MLSCKRLRTRTDLFGFSRKYAQQSEGCHFGHSFNSADETARVSHSWSIYLRRLPSRYEVVARAAFTETTWPYQRLPKAVACF